MLFHSENIALMQEITSCQKIKRLASPQIGRPKYKKGTRFYFIHVFTLFNTFILSLTLSRTILNTPKFNVVDFFFCY